MWERGSATCTKCRARRAKRKVKRVERGSATCTKCRARRAKRKVKRVGAWQRALHEVQGT